MDPSKNEKYPSNKSYCIPANQKKYKGEVSSKLAYKISTYGKVKEGRGGLTFIPPPIEDSKFPTVSVIVTLFSGDSFDELFKSKPQKAPEGKVSLFVLHYKYCKHVLNAFQGIIPEGFDDEFTDNLKKLINEIKLVSAESVLFNWECCSGLDTIQEEEHFDYNGIDDDYSKKHLVEKDDNLALIKYLLDNKHMLMFSDFAVDALINDWDIKLLGANPFIKLGECDRQIELNFIPSDLKESSSVQLQLVGQLCEKGKMVISAMPGTIVFGFVDEKVRSYPEYEINLLTVVTKTTGPELLDNCEIAAKRGTIGHVMLKYKSGGVMLLSAGHWIEMSKFDVDLDNLESVVQDFGGEYKNKFSEIKSNNNMKEIEKYSRYQEMANDMIQKSTPCSYSNKVNFQKKYNKKVEKK